MTAASEILRLAQPPTRRFLPGVLFGLGSALSAVALIASSAYLITKAAEEPELLYLSLVIVAVRAFALGRSVFRYAERLSSHNAALTTLAALRVAIYHRLVPLAPAGLRSRRRGELLSGIVSDVDDLQDLPLRVIQPLVTAGSIAVLSVIGVGLVLPAAGATLLVCLVLAAVIGVVANQRVAASADRSVAPLRANLLGLIADFVRNLDVFIAFDEADNRLAAIERADARLRAVALRRAAGLGLATGSTALISGLAVIAALLVGIPAVHGGHLAGPFYAVTILVPLAVFEIFGAVPVAIGALRSVRASAERLASELPSPVPAEIPLDEGSDDSVLPFADGVSLSVHDLGARWPGAETSAVSGITFDLEPGERLLVIGESGSGKTTLANALVRFIGYSGGYSVGGVDARSLTPTALRRVVGLCEQAPFIFDNSIRQNLLFARETATDDDLLAVLDRVGLADWVGERGGLEAPVGERGALVSGGQAQRIALARALLADFPVLVLDEPTANVDADRADRLLEDILRAASAGQRSVVLISHVPVDPALITRTLQL
jgi:ATP-binding cassette subfamily C protein CydC